LVGGHCIGVDPYYLAHKASSLGYHAEVILSGRKVNDNMGSFVANKVVKLLIKKKHTIDGSKALILGITFKENCPDIRNSRVIDIYRELIEFGLKVDVFDPHASKEQVKAEYGIDLIQQPPLQSGTDHSYNAIILAVAHKEFLELDLKKLKTEDAIIYDTKAALDRRW
jgi:UDP-N-acetyl-D-galactosamine dehydrogenase